MNKEMKKDMKTFEIAIIVETETFEQATKYALNLKPLKIIGIREVIYHGGKVT